MGENYTYDGVGNRLTGPKTTDAMSYNAGNEQLNLNAIAYEYDANGNRIKKTGAGGVITNYTYDDENRLIQVTKGSDVITYTYDPMGRRIEKNVNGTITTYVYDNEAIILAYNAAGNIKAKYTHGPSLDEPLAVKKSGDIYYYHADGLGSIVALTDVAGAVVETYSYDSFGNMTKTGDIRQPFTYTGREFDSETGLYYYRARYYDAKAGRFLQRDPIGFDGGDVNLYAYVWNNPVNWIDPWGLWHCVPGANCNFTPAMRDALDCFDRCTRDNGGPCDNEITSGRRGGGGQHGSGEAADFNRANNPNLSREIAERCREKCFPRGWGSEERNGPNSSNPNGTHFHYQLNTVPGGRPRFAPNIRPYQPSPRR